jgi:hypothetical protein
MDRRAMLGMLGVGAVGVTFAGHEAEAGVTMLDKVHADCLKACSDCAQSCDMTFHHCYTQVAEGKRDHAKPLHLVSDCAGFCNLSASLIAKKSPFMTYSCQACAEACKATAAVVEKFDSEEMRMAAEKLRACEKSCIAMVEAMKSGHSADHSK